MTRKIIQIDQKKCIGCTLCAKACKQNAIAMLNGKATVMYENYCDGIGNCLPVCPVDAISFSDKDIVAKPNKTTTASPCKSSLAKSIKKSSQKPATAITLSSELSQWPVQLKLAPITAPYFDNADVLICADCCAYAYANFHTDFIKGKITLIACPKLDNCDYSDKLSQIFTSNNINSITLVKMEVPCCNGILNMTQSAISKSAKEIKLNKTTISLDGKIL